MQSKTNPEKPGALRHFLTLFGASGKPLRQRVPFPWGLLVLLVLYAIFVSGWLTYRYWTSPEYQAAVAYDEAWSLLGKDGGRSAPPEELQRAFELLIKAGYLMPQVKTIHQDMESLRFRYAEREMELPRHLEFGAEEASRRWLEIDEANQPILVVGARDRGWDYETLKVGPTRVLLWSVLLGFVFVLIALYVWWVGVVTAWEKREEHVQEVEADVEDLGRFRQGLK